jgi:hypothetical protein
MSGRSSTDSLQRLAPVSDADAAAVFGAAGRDELLDGVTSLPSGRRGRLERHAPRRRGRSLVLALAVVVAVATAAAAWAALHGSPARETTSVQCLIQGSDAVIPSTSGDPAHDCAVDYRREFGTTAPALVAYDNRHGGVTVLPRSEQPPHGWKPLRSQDVALIELQDSLDDYVNGLNASCLGSSAATSLARTELAKFGFVGWTVAIRSAADTATTSLPSPTVTSATSRAAPGVKSTPNSITCVAGDLVDPAQQTVTLIPTSVATGPQTTFQKLADKLRPLTRSCESLQAAVTSVRAAASSLGLSESAKTYQLNAVTDDSLRCASIYETVGGTIFVTIRGSRS